MECQADTGSWTGDLSGLRVFWSEILSLVRVVGALPLRSMAADTLGEPDSHPVPVVLVHGILGDATNFATLRHHLARHGIRRFSSFCYRPRLDYQRLVVRFGEHVSGVCSEAGATQVDVVAHSASTSSTCACSTAMGRRRSRSRTSSARSRTCAARTSSS
jgi:pimeloyl-ACP methyl ester carboxylesterase